MDLAESTLEDEIEDRESNSNYFSNIEIKHMMMILITVFTNLKEKLNIVHRDIKPSNILISNK